MSPVVDFEIVSLCIGVMMEYKFISQLPDIAQKWAQTYGSQFLNELGMEILKFNINCAEEETLRHLLIPLFSGTPCIFSVLSIFPIFLIAKLSQVPA